MKLSEHFLIFFTDGDQIAILAHHRDSCPYGNAKNRRCKLAVVSKKLQINYRKLTDYGCGAIVPKEIEDKFKFIAQSIL